MTNPTQKQPRPRPNPYTPERKGGGLKLGCLRSKPDPRDFRLSKLSGRAAETLKQANDKRSTPQSLYMLSNPATLPVRVDLTKSGFFTEVEDQKNLGSCTANAVIGLVEYFIKSSTGLSEDYSRIFLYKVTRNLMGDQGIGDSGAYIRDTIKAMRLFGVVPEKWWPYTVEDFDIEPDAFIYNMAQNFQTMDYLRLDDYSVPVWRQDDQQEPNEGKAKTPVAQWKQNLNNIKSAIADGFPAAFGFWVPDLSKVSNSSPYLPPIEDIDYFDGGHAVLAVGYDDDKKAIKFRNSWGADWGESGYAWMPYEYLEHDIAFDFWTILNQEWVELKYFL